MFTLCVSFSACDHGAALVGEPPTFVKRHSAPVATRGAEAEADDVVVVVLMLPGHTDTSFAAGASLPLSGAQTTLVQHTVDAIQLAARPVDASPNELHPDAFIAEARAVAQRTTSKITAIQRVQLRHQGFGGIYGVGKAATHKPALVCLSHVPEGAAEDAKGVTMNSVGPDSTRVDDVLVMYSGKTVEVNNTDAEGRLVLADGVAYAVKHLNPKVYRRPGHLDGQPHRHHLH
ncbi:hypothetical protein PR002_g25631 [Phytophthora rubi]|uniref:Cytosol aminopeptidase domain-containing protein n=1 Tax=Phytophthora rubi TaxID=129364 RepID=A0A6A3HXD0_9STRA|nr:hypothetical protein PR002_g25631 [Phytophthora rubi]